MTHGLSEARIRKMAQKTYYKMHKMISVDDLVQEAHLRLLETSPDNPRLATTIVKRLFSRIYLEKYHPVHIPPTSVRGRDDVAERWGMCPLINDPICSEDVEAHDERLLARALSRLTDSRREFIVDRVGGKSLEVLGKERGYSKQYAKSMEKIIYKSLLFQLQGVR